MSANGEFSFLIICRMVQIKESTKSYFASQYELNSVEIAKDPHKELQTLVPYIILI